MKVLAIIPAYNEEASVAAVVEALGRVRPALDVVVVDDGSSDATAEAARAAGARVLSLPFNLGIGGAVQTGYLYARDNGYDVAIQVDGDGQHDPAEIPKLLGPLQEGRADLVGGSRFLDRAAGYRASVPRRLGILYFSWVLSALLLRRVTDPTSGFRAANRRAIELFSRDYPTDYPEVDSLVLLWRHDLHSQEVPVEMSPRQGGQSSISWIRAIYYMVKVTLSIGVHLLRAPGGNP